MSKSQIYKLESQLNFSHQDTDKMKPHELLEYETLLLTLQKEG